MNSENTFALDLPFELKSLARAHNYQNWIADTVRPYLGKRICEVGAGIGNMSGHLPVRETLLLTEADPKLHYLLEREVPAKFGEDARVQTLQWDLSAGLPAEIANGDLDTIVSFNVLEHIERDVDAMHGFISLLKKSRSLGPKRIVTFVPAHRWAYGSLDKTFGHFRRYSNASFRKVVKATGFDVKVETRYFNLFGLAGWLVVNRLLRRTEIDEQSVALFEMLCPRIRNIDDFLHARLGLPLGQSLLTVVTVDPATH